MYKRYNFNDDSLTLESKFKAKEQNIMRDMVTKRVEEQRSANKFIEKLKNLENPLINELMMNKLTQKNERKHKTEKVHSAMKELKSGLDFLQ